MKLKNITIKYQTDSETVIKGIRNFKKLINGEDKTQPALVISIDSIKLFYCELLFIYFSPTFFTFGINAKHCT